MSRKCSRRQPSSCLWCCAKIFQPFFRPPALVATIFDIVFVNFGLRRRVSMSSPVSYHSLRHAHDDHVEDQPDDQDRSTWPISERHSEDESSALRTSSNDCQPQTSLPDRPVSSHSKHGNDMSGPASLENKSRSSSAEIDEKKSQDPASKQPGWWSKLVEDSWTVELVAGFVSFAAITSIIGVLWGYDQKPVPRLMKGITVSMLLSAWRMAMGG